MLGYPRATYNLVVSVLAMDTSTIIAKLRQHEGELRSEGVEHLSLFGSWARGTAVPALSDVDLLAEFDSGREYSLLDRVRLENRLADLLGAKVDLAPAQTLKDGIRERVTREAMIAF
jgi:predicted nucleotidyltransferase